MDLFGPAPESQAKQLYKSDQTAYSCPDPVCKRHNDCRAQPLWKFLNHLIAFQGIDLRHTPKGKEGSINKRDPVRWLFVDGNHLLSSMKTCGFGTNKVHQANASGSVASGNANTSFVESSTARAKHAYSEIDDGLIDLTTPPKRGTTRVTVIDVDSDAESGSHFASSRARSISVGAGSKVRNVTKGRPVAARECPVFHASTSDC